MSEKYTFAVGEMLAGRYRIEAELGRGGMGVVLTARHVLLDELFAIKVIHPHLANVPEIVERFLREARASSSIKSPHCARVTDVDRLPDGPPYMVMEYLEGNDVAKVLAQRGTFSVSDALDCVRQACDAIGEAHARGIYHRDLKPGNLFLTRDRHGAPLVKVLDFGISKMVDSGDGLTLTDTILGTPAYMSPEQVLQAKNVDGRTDIWALGCILYRLLTGVLPFRNSATRSTQQAVHLDTPVPPTQLRPDIPAAVEAIVLRCLEKAPEKRYPTASQLVEAIDAVSATGPVAHSTSTATGFPSPAGFAEPPPVVSVPAPRGPAAPPVLTLGRTEPQEPQPKSLLVPSLGVPSDSALQASPVVSVAPLGGSGPTSESTTNAGLSKGHASGELTSSTEAALNAKRRKRVRIAGYVALGAALVVGLAGGVNALLGRNVAPPTTPATAAETVAAVATPEPSPAPPPTPTASVGPIPTQSGPPPPQTAPPQTAPPPPPRPTGAKPTKKCDPQKDYACP
jgi:serine/threonine protein kinase